MTTSSTPTSARAESLAAQFEEVNQAAVAAAGAHNSATATAEENWPLPFAAWHIADGHTMIMGLITLTANGQPLPPVTAEMLNAANAEHFAQHGGCTAAESQALLRQNGAAAAAAIRALMDEQLDRSAVVALLGEEPLSVQQMIELALIGHAQGHLTNLQAAL